MGKNVWKIIVAAVAIVVYIGVLVYIESNQSEYDVVILTEKELYEFSEKMEEEYIIPITIKNYANRMLSSIEGQDVYLTYHLYDADGNLLIYENVRSTFEEGIFAKSRGEVDLHITPMKGGEYIIGVDLVHENVAWFSENAEVERKIHVVVK